MDKAFKFIIDLLNIFTKETNRMRALLIIAIIVVLGGFGYLFKSNNDTMAKLQDQQMKNEVLTQKYEKERAETQGKLSEKIVEEKSLGTNTAVGNDVSANGSAIGNNNTVNTTSNTGGVVLANATLNNSNVSYIVQNFTMLSDDKIQEVIKKLTKEEGNTLLQVMNEKQKTPTDVSEKSKIDVVINAIFARFNFTNTKSNEQELDSVAGKILDVYYDYWGVKNYPGCKLDINTITPITGGGNYGLRINATYRINDSQKYCYMYLPNNLIAEFEKRQLGYFQPLISKNTNDIMNWAWTKKPEGYSSLYVRDAISNPVYNDGTPRNFDMYLKWNKGNGDMFSLSDVKRLKLTFYYTHPAPPTGEKQTDHMVWNIQDNDINLLQK